ncbi:MAG TPA: chemotaxis protein CheX [Vicinamibacterales bacterium]|nr:chemotaxis protein CheX [Vicinamibacterales bacterium]
MSSLSLPEIAGREQLALLEEALVLVAEHSFLSYAASCDLVRFAELHDAMVGASAESPRRWLRASVAFRGESSGAVAIGVPEPLALHLFASFAGGDPDGLVTDDQLRDTVGELTNMIAGRWLMLAFHGRPFELVPPAVSWQDGAVGGWVPADTHIMHACIQDMPMLIGVMES